MDLQPPARVGRYDVERKLGEGGMGVVYAARDRELDRAVALKAVRGGADPRARERLRREARAAASVNHPGICQIYEIVEHGDDLFVAMELLDGEPLLARIARGPLPVTDAVPIGLGMLGALEALHQRGFVHRDVKPSNVFLTAHGVKLLDFGLARSLMGASDETAPDLTLPGTVLGSPGYMAPEQINQAPLDARADLFGAGAVLHEALVGRPPFTGATAVAVLHAVLYEQPPALSGSTAIAAVDRVIRRALAKRAEDRYASAAEMAQQLRAVLAHLDSGETPRAQAMTRLAVLPFRVLRPDPDVDFLAFSLADAVATTLSGLGSLLVRSSVAMAKYADQASVDVKAIAAEAEVDVVLVGTLLRAGDQLRVSTQLVAAPAGTILWSQTSQVPLGDVFQLQDELVRRLVESLSAPLTAREQRRLDRDVPANAKAYELFLRANQHFYHAQDWTIARELYVECLREDPQFAPAWARLGRCYRLTAKFTSQSAAELDRNLARADEAFRKALEISPDLPAAHNLYTFLEADLGRAADAVVRLLGQARTRPNDPELYAGLVHACRYCGLVDASIAAHDRARQLDPNVPTSVAHSYWMKGDYARAMEEKFGGYTFGYIRGLAMASLGRTDEAIAFLREREGTAGETMGQKYLFVLRALLEGRPRESLDVLTEDLVAHNPDPESRYYLARMMVQLGAADRALSELAWIVGRGFYCYPVLVRDPWLDPLRGRAAFTATLRRAEGLHRAAAARFRDAGGDRLLDVGL